MLNLHGTTAAGALEQGRGGVEQRGWGVRAAAGATLFI